MSYEEVFSEVNKIFIDFFEDESIDLEYETTADDIEDWDSLTHVQLILKIEKHFKIKFRLAEVQKFKNVGVMCDYIVQHLNNSTN